MKRRRLPWVVLGFLMWIGRVSGQASSAPIDDALRPGPGPELLPAEPAWQGWFALGTLGVILALAIRVIWGLGRGRVKPGPPPHLWALAQLDQIPPPVDGDVTALERFVVQLAEIVRHYLERRFHVPALERTTSEFLHYLQGLPELSCERRAVLGTFLDRADLAKFARSWPSRAEADELRVTVRDLIRGMAPSD